MPEHVPYDPHDDYYKSPKDRRKKLTTLMDNERFLLTPKKESNILERYGQLSMVQIKDILKERKCTYESTISSSDGYLRPDVHLRINYFCSALGDIEVLEFQKFSGSLRELKDTNKSFFNTIGLALLL